MVLDYTRNNTPEKTENMVFMKKNMNFMINLEMIFKQRDTYKTNQSYSLEK